MERIMKKILLFLIVGSSLSTEGMSALPIKSQSMDDLSEMTRVLDNGFTRGELSECGVFFQQGDSLKTKGILGEQSSYLEDAYFHFKKAICGSGTSEYSKVLTNYINECIEAFCSHKTIDVNLMKKFESHARRIERYAILGYFNTIISTLEGCVSLEKINDRSKTIRFQKEKLFWMLLDEKDPHDLPLDYRIKRELEALCVMMK
jgi:hypothetical protein